MNILSFVLCMFAGLGAGIATGFAGLSAAVIISPVLIAFLGVPTYDAVGIALASDVLASAASSVTYYRNKNINIKSGIVMMVTAVLFTYAGSRLALFIHTEFSTLMKYFPIAITFLLGIRFLLLPKRDTQTHIIYGSDITKLAASVLGGILIGLCCGMIGAGGGMMILIMLTMVLGYDLKTAVGTSVFIMTAIALTGSLSHFFISPDFSIWGYLPELLLCVIFTLIGAISSARIANRVSHKTMSFLTGGLLLFIGVFTLIGVLLSWNVN